MRVLRITSVPTRSLFLLAATLALASPCRGAAPVADCTGQAANVACADDGNSCTADLCNGAGSCTHPTKPSNTPCDDDGKECTYDLCSGSTCTHVIVPNLSACTDDGNPCTRDICNGSDACSHPPVGNAQACTDDHNPCTIDLCNGSVCDHTPASNSVACDDDGNSCTRDLCDSAGACTHVPMANFAACATDGNACTVDLCTGGTCTHQGPATCTNNCATDPAGTPCASDGNSCTIDICAGGMCGHQPSPSGQACTDDGNACTFEQCNGAGACVSSNIGPAAPCTSDSNDCTLDLCNGAGTCQHSNVGAGATCNADSNDCTFEQCNGLGACQRSNLPSGARCRDEGNDCTHDLCNGTGTCTHDNETAVSSCNDDFDPCTLDTCDSAGTCTHTRASGCVTPPQTSAQAKCITGLNGAGVKLSAAQGKENVACIDAAAGGDETSPLACLSADTKGKVDSAATKVTGTFASKCATLPDFGADATAPILASADDERRALVVDLFGPFLDAAVTGDDDTVAGCQTAVETAMEKIVDAELKTFVKCKKKGLKETITSRLGLDDCLLAVGAAADDPDSKLGKTVAKLTVARAQACDGVSFYDAFWGDCGHIVGFSIFDACVRRLAECRACRIVVATDGPFVNCDVFDDGFANTSCPVD